MLTQDDLKAIQSIISSSLGSSEKTIEKTVISAVGEMVEENILPQFIQLRTELLTQLPSKAFIADKLADLEGSVIVRQRKEDQKVLAQDEVNMLKTFEVFQSPSAR